MSEVNNALKSIEGKVDTLWIKQDELIGDFETFDKKFDRHEVEEFSLFWKIQHRMKKIEEDLHTIEDKVNNHDIKMNWLNIAIGTLFVLVVLLFIIVMT